MAPSLLICFSIGNLPIALHFQLGSGSKGQHGASTMSQAEGRDGKWSASFAFTQLHRSEVKTPTTPIFDEKFGGGLVKILWKREGSLKM